MIARRQRSRYEIELAVERVRADGPIPASQAARKVPANNRHGYASVDTVVRWITKGKRGVYLDGALLSGKGWWTSEAALARFFAALAAAAAPGPGLLGGMTVREWEARAEREGRELDALLGIKPGDED